MPEILRKKPREFGGTEGEAPAEVCAEDTTKGEEEAQLRRPSTITGNTGRCTGLIIWMAREAGSS